MRESKRDIILRTEGRHEAIREATYTKSIDPLIHVMFAANDLTEDVPIANNSVPYILQKYSFEWDEFLDVTDVNMILDRDRLRVIPRSPPVAQTLAHNRPASVTVSPCSSHTSVSDPFLHAVGLDLLTSGIKSGYAVAVWASLVHGHAYIGCMML